MQLTYYALKILIAASVLVAITELTKRSSSLAALLAALPLTSLLAFVWLHLDGAPPSQVAELSRQIFWLVIPSLLLFILLPVLLKQGMGFWLSLSLASFATIAAYFASLPLLRRFAISL